ncbi:MAG TPA: MIP/aquaporin family protein [Solirubrobacteraceae bacterium]|nr:MIP/aquaporin family protein [Solirubrobacteraceae bacterium]
MSTVADSMAVGPLPLRWRQGVIGEYWAEFFGCFILICFGDGVVAMLWALIGSGRSSAGALQSSGDWLLITWGWALAVCFAVYTVGGVTGAHINPAITLGAAIRKQLPWGKVPGYWIAQVVGCFVGAALVYLVYVNAIDNFNIVGHCGTVLKGCVPIKRGSPASVATYSTFATFPALYFHTVWGPLIDQVVGTFFLALFVWAVTDEYGLAVGANLTPWIVGMIVMAVGISFGANAGYAINPARDFGPRIFAWIAGWGKVAFPGDYVNISNYFWVPIVGPLIGAALASFFYDSFIRSILIARKPPEPGIVAEGETVQDRPGPERIP